MKRYIFFLIAIFLSYSRLAAQDIRKYTNEFLQIGVTSRGIAMGHTLGSIENNASSVYWNPAGLMRQEKQYDGVLMHTEYFGGIASYDFAAFSTKIDKESSLGIGLIRLGVDQIPDTRYLFDENGLVNYDNIRSFSAADYAFLFSYARRVINLKGFSYGVTTKVIHRDAGIFASAWGVGVDLAAQYHVKHWHLGLNVKDALGTYTSWFYNPETFYEAFQKTGNTIPENNVEIALPSIALDISHNFVLPLNFEFLLATGLYTTFDGRRNTIYSNDNFAVDVKAGAELSFKQMIYLRAGINQIQQFQENSNQSGEVQKTSYIEDSYTTSAGLGVKFKGFRIDYALSNSFGDQALYSHVFTLGINIGKSISDKARYQYDDE